jgi:hypothetical protein
VGSGRGVGRHSTVFTYFVLKNSILLRFQELLRLENSDLRKLGPESGCRKAPKRGLMAKKRALYVFPLRCLYDLQRAGVQTVLENAVRRGHARHNIGFYPV